MIQPTGQPVLIECLGVFGGSGDTRGEGDRGVAVLVEPVPGWPALRVIAVGSAKNVHAHEAAGAPGMFRLSRPECVLMPGMVNAHTHLDLTHIGPRPHDPEAGFVPWIEMIRSNRCGTPDEIASSIARGAELSLKAGVVAVGDIAGAVGGRASIAGFDALAASRLAGVSFVEFFALGCGRDRGLDGLRAALADAELRGAFRPAGSRVRLGIQPHAPYSVSPGAFAESARLVAGRGPMSTHLAESPEERALVEGAAGPLRRMLEDFGLWTDDEDRDFGGGNRTPVGHLRELLRHIAVAAHVNDASDADLAILRDTGVSVAYCPRASAYFGAERHFGPHRYRDMLRLGINVALGTDSIVNLPADAETRGLSILDEMRFLFRRDETDAETLLAMGTVNGARALGLPAEAFRIRAGAAIAGVVSVPLTGRPPDARSLAEAVMRSNTLPELLLPTPGGHPVHK